MTVRGVLAEADVGEQQLGEARPERAECLLDKFIRDQMSTGAVVVLLLRDPEQDHDADAPRSSSSHSRTAPSTVNRPIAGSASFGRTSDATNNGITRSSSETVVSRTRVAQRAAPAQPPQPSGRERAHAERLTPGYAAALRGLDRGRLDLDRDTGAAGPALERDPLGEELPGGPADCEDQGAIKAPISPSMFDPASSPRSRAAGEGEELPSPSATIWPSTWWMPRKSRITRSPRTGARRARRSRAGSTRATGRGRTGRR